MYSYNNSILDAPEWNDDKLCVLGPVFDVVGDNGHIPEIERCIDLVHEVQRCRLRENVSNMHGLRGYVAYLVDMQSEYES